jgi:hypothetical protein
MRQIIVEWARILAEKGVECSTGFAEGVDMACVEGCASVNPSLLHLYMPWRSYNQVPQNGRKAYSIPEGAHVTVYDERTHKDWTESVHKCHPAARNLTRGPFALHARNYGILMDQKVDAVFALPKGISDLGGTGQGMRIAKENSILLFNLLDPEDRNNAAFWIDSI